jgi:CubicO group peptidase (beta-lactamase class C family)
MRSGLVPICFIAETGSAGECQNESDGAAGGNIVFAQDQMSACIHRPLASDGASYPWLSGGTYRAGEFLYANCDTQVLGEILYRATGQDPGIFAETELFEPLNIDAFWWRDNVETGQSNGNYLTYCCLDSTARDFAKFGYLIQLGELELESGKYYSNYIADITAISSFYDKQFWSFCGETNDDGECVNTVIHTSGFDGQFIVIDRKNDLVIVRASLYQSYLNFSDERKMRLVPGLVAESNWTGSLPQAMAIPTTSSFSIREFHARVVSALTTGG